MSDKLIDYVLQHTERGECKCGQCIDAGDKKDPTGHTADLCFFVVSKRGEPKADEFIALTKEHKGFYGDVNPFDDKEHNYMELGGWIGDQGIAMQYMGLGTLLGVFDLLTPKTMLGLEEGPMVMQMAGMGMVVVKARREKAVSATVAASK